MINFLISFIDLPNKFKILKFLKDEFKRKKINVIDIGAHKGETINFFLKNFLVNKLIAFEPNRILFELLQKKFDDDRISIFNFGVGFKKKKKFLMYLLIVRHLHSIKLIQKLNILKEN